MPTFIIQEGIKIECFSGDHPPPHIHDSYGGKVVLIVIENQSVYEGDLPPKKLKRAKEIVRENSEDLLCLFNELNKNLLRKK